MNGRSVDRLVDKYGQVMVRQRDVLYRGRRPLPLATVAVGVRLKN